MQQIKILKQLVATFVGGSMSNCVTTMFPTTAKEIQEFFAGAEEFLAENRDVRQVVIQSHRFDGVVVVTNLYQQNPLVEASVLEFDATSVDPFASPNDKRGLSLKFG